MPLVLKLSVLVGLGLCTLTRGSEVGMQRKSNDGTKR